MTGHDKSSDLTATFDAPFIYKGSRSKSGLSTEMADIVLFFLSRIYNCHSSTFPPKCGIPQGSTLGPFMLPLGLGFLKSCHFYVVLHTSDIR